MALFTPVRRWQPAFRPFRRLPLSDRLLAFTERCIKGPLFGCRMCGNCLLQETAFICHMECPKGLRNGPCGGVNEGHCYVDTSRRCVWFEIYKRSAKMHRQNKLLEILPPVDWDRAGGETWAEVIGKVREAGLKTVVSPIFRKGQSFSLVLEERVFKPIRQPSWWNGDSEYHAPAYSGHQSHLESELGSGRFVITSEVSPPISAATDKLAEKIHLLKPFVTSINFTDGSSAIPKMSSVACSSLAASLGVDPVLQISARDNNRFTLQSQALGANALGIKNILCLTGDSPRVGHKPRGNMNINDVDSIQMLWILRRMRDEGIYLDGREMKNRPKLFLGAAASPFAQDPGLQVIRDRKKINAGAQFFQTNLVFDPHTLDPWLESLYKEGLLDKVFILIGVSPLKTLNLAKYLNDNIPGISVPDKIIRRMEKAGSNAQEEGIRIAVEIIRELRRKPGINGVHIMPIGWESAVPQLVQEAMAE